MTDRIAICIPSRGLMYSEFVQSLWAAIEYFRGVYSPPDAEIAMHFQHYTPMPDCRTELVERALQDGASHIMFIDDDMKLPENAITRLYEHDDDVVTALCWNKSREDKSNPMIGFLGRSFPIVKWTKEWYWPNHFEIDGCGLACCMIKANVFLQIQPWFDWNWTQKIYRPLTGATVNHTTPQGEDLFFCKQLRDAEIKIHCDSGVIVQHMLFHHEGDGGYDGMCYWVEYFPEMEELEAYRAGNPMRIVTINEITPREYWDNHYAAMEVEHANAD